MHVPDATVTPVQPPLRRFSRHGDLIPTMLVCFGPRGWDEGTAHLPQFPTLPLPPKAEESTAQTEHIRSELISVTHFEASLENEDK